MVQITCGLVASFSVRQVWSVHLSAPFSVGGLLEGPNSQVVCDGNLYMDSIWILYLETIVESGDLRVLV